MNTAKEFRVAALRAGKLAVAKTEAGAPEAVVSAAVIEFANLGFLVNPLDLTEVSTKELQESLSAARTIVGADRAMTPIYPGFPKQVEELSSARLFMEQILHYWTGGEFLPNYPEIAREGLPLEDMVRSSKRIGVMATPEAAKTFATTLPLAPIALSEADRELLDLALELAKLSLDEVATVTAAAKNGENLQVFLQSLFLVSGYSNDEIFFGVVAGCANLDQLLRATLTLYSEEAAEQWKAKYELATATLANRHARSVRMMKICRPVRRALISRVGELSTGFKADSLVARQGLWRGVMRAVHPYDFKLTAAEKRAMDIVHSNGAYRTLNSLVEEAMAEGRLVEAVELLRSNQPGNLLRRLVALLRLVESDADAEALRAAIKTAGAGATVSTLISAYNGVVSANDSRTRVTRVAGLRNTMVDRSEVKQVNNKHLMLVAGAVKDSLRYRLGTSAAPGGPVAIKSETPVSLVDRDLSTADRTMERGERMPLEENGNILRFFGHWNNNMEVGSYMDIGVALLDNDFNVISVSTWNSHLESRGWSTYSGDKYVDTGESAAEYIDVKLDKLKDSEGKAAWAAMSVQAWAGWGIEDVDFIAGVMVRADGEKGQVFEPRSIATAFKPTTSSSQAVPLVVNLKTREMIWLDSSSGAKAAGVSANGDSSIGEIAYDEIARPRLSYGELAALWAKAHGAEQVDAPADHKQLRALLS